MAKINYENWCPDYDGGCGHTWDTEGLPGGNCPKCGRENPCRTAFTTCDCGARVYLEEFTNQCGQCGKYYNSFGQELCDPDSWDSEDRYAIFGPQNDSFDDNF